MSKSTRYGFLRMRHLHDLTGKTYSKQAKRLPSKNAFMFTDTKPSYNAITPHVSEHQPKKSNPKMLPKPCLRLPLAMLSVYSWENIIIYLIYGSSLT